MSKKSIDYMAVRYLRGKLPMAQSPRFPSAEAAAADIRPHCRKGDVIKVFAFAGDRPAQKDFALVEAVAEKS
jgi:hypothetical protein